MRSASNFADHRSGQQLQLTGKMCEVAAGGAGKAPTTGAWRAPGQAAIQPAAPGPSHAMWRA
ncbi:hypothetical protein ACU4GD_15605 [Cupriavidus basilensis]